MPAITKTLAGLALAIAARRAAAQNSEDVSVGNFVATPLPNTGTDGKPAVYATYTVAGGNMAGEKRAIARAILELGATCPEVLINEADNLPMTQRGVLVGTGAKAEQFRTNFPVVVCEVTLPSDASSASVLGQPLPIPDYVTKTVAWIGDTGCRPQSKQDCASVGTDRYDFPLSLNSAKIAAAKPGLVVHVGDYVYRDCSGSGKEICDATVPNTPYGNNWATWASDFFVPAREMLQAAAFVFNRGNHEICDRVGTGFFLFLDHGEYPTDLTEPHCKARVSPYYVHGGSNLAIWSFDNTDVDDGVEYVNDGTGGILAMAETVEAGGWASSGTCQSEHCKRLASAASGSPAAMVTTRVSAVESNVAAFKPLLQAMEAQMEKMAKDGRMSIFTSHRPVGAIMKVAANVSYPGDVTAPDENEDSTYNLVIDYVNLLACPQYMAATGKCFSDASGMTLFVAGHMHTLQVLEVATTSSNTKVEPRIVVGNGGVLLNGAGEEGGGYLVGEKLGGLTVDNAIAQQEYGYGIQKLSSDGCWETRLYNSYGEQIGDEVKSKCSLKEPVTAAARGLVAAGATLLATAIGALLL